MSAFWRPSTMPGLQLGREHRRRGKADEPRVFDLFRPTDRHRFTRTSRRRAAFMARALINQIDGAAPESVAKLCRRQDRGSRLTPGGTAPQQTVRKRSMTVSRTSFGIALPPVLGLRTPQPHTAPEYPAFSTALLGSFSKIGNAVPHHAAIQKHVRGVLKPVAEVIAEDAPLGFGLEALRQRTVPPDVIDIDGDPDIRPPRRISADPTSASRTE